MKLGQPVPDSNLRFVGEERLAAAGAGEGAGAFLGVQRAAAGALGGVPAEDLILLWRQDFPPLLVGLLNGKICHYVILADPMKSVRGALVCSLALLWLNFHHWAR